MKLHKGIALETTAYLIIGLLSLMLMIMLFSGHIKGAAMKMYCNIYDTLLARIPFTEISPPSYCGITSPPLITNSIYYDDKNKIIEYLTSEIIKCYMKMNNQPLSDEVICSEIVLKSSLSESINEKDITYYLYTHDLCELLGNDDINIMINGEIKKCGEGNHIQMMKELNANNNHIFIIYDYKEDKVVIK